MITIEDPSKLPDVGYVFCLLNDIPCIVLDADGPLWATTCMVMREEKLVFKYAYEFGSGESGFLLYMPPHIEAPLLAGDINDGSNQFSRMLEEGDGNWILVLQFILNGKKQSRLFSVVQDQMKIVPSESGHEVWEGWIIPNPETAR